MLTSGQKKQLVEVLSIVSYSKMARPWTKQTEIRILRDTIARAVFGISLTGAQAELFREALNMYLESLESMKLFFHMAGLSSANVDEIRKRIERWLG